MEELLALQAELAAVQSAPSSLRLSEPNAVEVVSKLRELGLLSVLFTTNGKEYITPEHLRDEVADEILSRGGRVNEGELVALLNVDLPHIQRALSELIASPTPTAAGSLQRFQGDVIADVYLENLVEEIAGELAGAGKLSIGELAVQHTLTSEFLSRLLAQRLGESESDEPTAQGNGHVLGSLGATMSGGSLYTKAFVARHAARVRGVLSALSRPASLPQLIREYGLNESLFHECVAELVATGRVAGVLSGRNSFTPAVYARAQAASVLSFFQQNGRIEYAALAKLQESWRGGGGGQGDA